MVSTGLTNTMLPKFSSGLVKLYKSKSLEGGTQCSVDKSRFSLRIYKIIETKICIGDIFLLFKIFLHPLNEIGRTSKNHVRVAI